MKLQNEDLALIKEKGISEEGLDEQLEMLRRGFPFLRLDSAATPGNGISRLTPEMEIGAITCWEEFLDKGGTVMKMVPASGAASRMFKDLYSFVNGKSERPDTDFMKKFFERIEDFAFFPRLNFITLSNHGLSVDSLVREKRYKDIASSLIDKSGLNYGHLPKALIQFHKVTGTSRTALEEHLAEGAAYAAEKGGNVRVHFTVSEDHLPLVRMKVEEAAGHLGHKYGVRFDISYS